MIPSGIVTTAWPRVVAKCEDLGVTFDPWQHGIGSIALGKRADGKYAATVGGVVLSIPRQVGKTFLVGMIVIALCILFPGLTVLWTAHRTRTATKTFASLKAMTSRKKIRPLMLEPRNTNGEQEIRFRNGSVIMFGAREQGFGRGFDEVDVEVFDEAQILTEKALEDMVPAANQSRQESGALVFFMGTPPRPTDTGEEFTNRRIKALSGKTENMVYVEFSADRGCDPDDHKQWAKANPSFPLRTPLESMERMREQLTSEDSFLREALGVWDEIGAGLLPNWPNCSTDNPTPAPTVLGLAVSIDREWTSIAAAGQGERLYLGSVHRSQGTATGVAEAIRISLEQGIPVTVDKGGPAADLIPELETAGVRLLLAGTSDYLDACAGLFDAVAEGEVEHGDYDDLNTAVRVATKRRVSERWAFGRKSGDVSMLEAAALARWGALNDTSVYEDRGLVTL